MAVMYSLVENKEDFLTLVQIGLMFISFVTWYIYFMVSKLNAPFELGIIASGVNVVLYGAPIADLPKVIRSGDVSSMPVGLCAASFLCSAFWWGYGLQLSDVFIIYPNLLGVVLGVVQFAVILGVRIQNPEKNGAESNTEDTDTQEVLRSKEV